MFLSIPWNNIFHAKVVFIRSQSSHSCCRPWCLYHSLQNGQLSLCLGEKPSIHVVQCCRTRTLTLFPHLHVLELIVERIKETKKSPFLGLWHFIQVFLEVVTNFSTNTFFYIFHHLMGPDKIKKSRGTPPRIQAGGQWNETSLNIVRHELSWSGSWPVTLVYFYNSAWHRTTKLDICSVFELV